MARVLERSPSPRAPARRSSPSICRSAIRPARTRADLEKPLDADALRLDDPRSRHARARALVLRSQDLAQPVPRCRRRRRSSMARMAPGRSASTVRARRRLLCRHTARNGVWEPTAQASASATPASALRSSPNIISPGYGSGFLAEFDWTGRVDCERRSGAPRRSIAFHSRPRRPAADGGQLRLARSARNLDAADRRHSRGASSSSSRGRHGRSSQLPHRRRSSTNTRASARDVSRARLRLAHRRDGSTRHLASPLGAGL